MADDLVPQELRDFIVRHIDSIAQLEALLLLRANRAETWDVTKVAKRLYTSEQEAGEVLARLCADGLLSCDDGLYQYRGHDDQQLPIVEQLAESYAKHLIPITNMIHAKPRRIREFADAFKFRKDQ